jgi:hypothetical protein
MSLTPAEALVLLDPMGDQGIQAAKVTFLGLMAEGVLRQQTIENRFMGSHQGVRVAREPAAAPPHVAAVLEAVRYSKSGRVSDIAARLSKTTNRFASFVPDLVRPRLVQRGLLAETRRQEQRRTLLLFRRTVTVSTFHPTEAGKREQARIRDAIDQGPEIRALLDSDPPRAAAMALALGPLLLLIPALMPVLGQLSGAMAAQQSSIGMSDSGGTWDSGWEDGLSEFDGAIDGALSDAASDSSSDSDGDSGGSDGGGGE